MVTKDDTGESMSRRPVGALIDCKKSASEPLGGNVAASVGRATSAVNAHLMSYIRQITGTFCWTASALLW